MSESTIMLAVQDDLISQVNAAVKVSTEAKLVLICAIDRLYTPASVSRFLTRFSFIMEFELVTTSLKEDFEAEQSAQKVLTPVTSPASTAKSGGQGDMVDATSMAHPWKVASEPADAISIFTAFVGLDYDSARNSIDSLQAQYDTPSQSGALEEGVDDDDDLPGDFTYPASTAEFGGQGYMGDTATMSTHLCRRSNCS